MIVQPPVLFGALLGIIFGLKILSKRLSLRKFFDVLPVPFWCYMLPMAATSLGLFPSASPLYGFLSKWGLPVCLAWLLVGVDVRAMAGLGTAGVLLMAVGFGGVVGGTVLASALLKPWLPPEAWKSLGALAASWTGGSANMLAVKEALAAPESVFAPVVVTDGIFAYAWMSLLISVAGQESRFNGWSRPSEKWARLLSAAPEAGGAPVPAALVAGLAAAAALAGVWVSPRLPVLGGALTPAAWSVLLATSGALLTAVLLSGRRRRVPEIVEKAGSFLLLILVASLGARATFSAAARSPVFLAAGVTVLLVHGAVILAAARIGGIPLSLLATTSQACIGGVVSTPMVAAVYRPALAAVGLLLAVAANAVGTYVGLLTASLCRWVMR